MKLEFNKDQLLNALNTVTRAIPTRTTNPILECVLFEAADHEIRLTANDTEFGIETVVDGTIAEEGKLAIEAKLCQEIVRKLEGGDSPVVIESDETFLTTIRCEDAVFRIPGRDGEEFAYLPEIDRSHYISMSQFTLKQAVQKTIFSAALNDSNRMMGGLFLEVNGEKARFVALDGHRIAVQNVTLREDYGSAKAIIPGRTISEISKLMTDDNEKEVVLFFSENQVLFSFDRTVIVTRLIEGEYFNIDRMISKSYETKVTVSRSRFLSDVERAVILIKESDHKPVILDIQSGEIRLQAKSAFGSMNSRLQCEQAGRDLMIAFNPRYLADALRNIDDDTVAMYMTNARAPMYFCDDRESYFYLILPVNFVV